MEDRDLGQNKVRKMVIKQNKYTKKVKAIALLSLIAIFLSIFTFAYYTNTAKYFQDSRQPDGYGGFAQQRNANEFIVDGCGTGTMLDTVTGICWLKNMNSTGMLNWTDSVSYCLNLNYAGHTDWKLPTRIELHTLVDGIGGTSGATCSTLGSFGFTNCQNNYYWSSDVSQPATSSAWFFGFSNNAGSYTAKTNTYYVVCVR